MTYVTTKSDSFEPATDTAAHLFDNTVDKKKKTAEHLQGASTDMMRASMALSRQDTLISNRQAIFLKTEPRAARPKRGCCRT